MRNIIVPCVRNNQSTSMSSTPAARFVVSIPPFPEDLELDILDDGPPSGICDENALRELRNSAFDFLLRLRSRLGFDSLLLLPRLDAVQELRRERE